MAFDPTKVLQEVVRGMAGKGGAKAKGGKPRKPGAKRVAANPQECQCGCGGMTRGGKFLPGHDARLKGRLKKAAADGDGKAKAELRSRGWA